MVVGLAARLDFSCIVCFCVVAYGFGKKDIQIQGIQSKNIAPPPQLVRPYTLNPLNVASS